MLSYDVVVIGSGPAGATTARFAAEAGLNVLIVDKKQELGAPIQCSGAVSAHALEDVQVEPDAEFVVTPIHGFIVYNESGESIEHDYRKLKPDPYLHTPLGYVVDRRRFDRHLTNMAQLSGAETWLKAEALGYKRIDDKQVEVQVRRLDGDVSLRTSVVVGADGLQSQVGKWAGLTTHIKLSELASCLQYVIDRVETYGLLEIIAGHEWAPGGYAWVFPKHEGLSEIGLGVIKTMTEHDANFYLKKFIEKSFMAERFKDLRILEIQGGGVPLASPLKTQFADNMVLVGDAARHVNPITGGGIHTALRCGAIAGSFLGELLAKNIVPTASALSDYQDRWSAAMGDAMWRLYKRKREIFKQRDLELRNQMLYETLASYFSPTSEYRKI
ncbi:MAG: NAD(P)/FAD-dependent oxidoreductase [Calditrichota bacterium]